MGEGLLIFRQLFESESCTYSYLLADPATREAVIIDPVVDCHERDVALINALGLTLIYAMDTHVHADHVTGSGALRERLGARTVISEAAGLDCVTVSATHGQRFSLGELEVEFRQTPGHTASCGTYVLRDGGQTYAFTGDALLIGGCGRTDFQGGDANQLYRSVYEQIFSLPDETVVFPGHDYKGRIQSSVAEEKAHNDRLRLGTTQDEFCQIMAALNFARPKRMDEALPANMTCGRVVHSAALKP